jgi:hypothetical protein
LERRRAVNIKKGSDRVVITFPALGIAVKIARIRIFRAVYLFLKEVFKRRWSTLKMRFTHPMKTPWSLWGMLFRGLASNWMEFYLYQKTKHPILQPTFLSLAGLVNVEKYNDPCTKETNPYLELRRIAGIRAMLKDMHHLSNPSNFCIVNGKLRFLDYGSKETRAFIIQYGSKVFEQFQTL